MASFISLPTVFQVLFSKNSSNLEDSKANPILKHIEIVSNIMCDITKPKLFKFVFILFGNVRITS